MARHPWIRSDLYPDRWTAVYRLYDANDRLLYVGIGYDYLARWKSHAKKDWWPQVARKDVIWYDNRLTAAWEETKAILTEDPVHNDHPGLNLLSLFVTVCRQGPYALWACPVRPRMLTSTFDHDKVFRDLERGRIHAAVAVEERLLGMIVPWGHYKKMCAAMGDPVDEDALTKADV